MRLLIGISLLAVMSTASAADGNADPCTKFRWDMTAEVALFRAAPTSKQRSAGDRPQSAPAVSVGRVESLTLKPQAAVQFGQPPVKTEQVPGAYAGLARFKVPAAGVYRVALDIPFWVDVVAPDGTAKIAVSFGGSPGCELPHKVVNYLLEPDTEYLLQLSAYAKPEVRFTITAARN